jgi:hypothetical protein
MAQIEGKLLEKVRKRYRSARSIADQWSDILEASFFYAVPFRNKFYEPKNFEGDMKNARVYDTTAVEATKSFVSKLQATMTPPQVQWGFLELDEQYLQELEVEDAKQAQDELDIYMRLLFNYIHESNFDVVVNECYFDLAVGTSCMVINQGDDKNPLLFTSIPIDKLAIEEAFNGKIESWYRTWEDIKINEINLRWKKAVISEDMRQRMATDIDAKESTIYEGVMFDPMEKKPYKYVVWTSMHVLLYEEYESNPGIVWRFQKTNNETWGRGPVMDALPSIISLNAIARIELASANLNTFRPYMAWGDGVFNPYTFKLEPFSVIPIAPVGASSQFPLQPLPDASNPQFGQFTIQDLRNQINKLLYADASDSLSVQPETATQLMINQQTLAQKVGPLFSRLQQEFLEPVIRRCAFILDKMGLLPKPRMKDAEIQFKYKSPLALSNGQQDISRLAQFIQMMQGIMGPEVTQMWLHPMNTPALMAESLQVDPRYLNDARQIQQVAQDQQNMQSAMMAQAQEEGGASPPPAQPPIEV